MGGHRVNHFYEDCYSLLEQTHKWTLPRNECQHRKTETFIDELVEGLVWTSLKVKNSKEVLWCTPKTLLD